MRWIEQWLNGRKQRAVIDGYLSEWINILSGVPQGSVLGPLLFIIYINDIDDYVVSRILKLPDDTQIYNKVNSVEDIENLRTDLGQLISWSKERQMLFHIEKSELCILDITTPKLYIIWTVCI